MLFYRKAVICVYNSNPYAGYFPQSGVTPWQRRQQPPVYSGEIINVNGIAGARSLRLAPNSSVILRDTNSPIVWLCEADGTGYFEPVPYTVSPYQEQPQADVNDMERRLARLEAMLLEQSDDEPTERPRRRIQQAEQPAE